MVVSRNGVRAAVHQCISRGCYSNSRNDEIFNLVAQGYTVTDTLKIARDMAGKLPAAQAARRDYPALKETGGAFGHPPVAGS